MQLVDADRAANEADELNAARPAGFQHRNRLACTITGRKHGIEQNDFGLREIHQQATEITYRAQGFLIAIKSDVTNSLGQYAQHSFKLAKAGTEDRYQNNRLRQNRAGAVFQRRLNFDCINLPILPRFAEQQDCQRLQIASKFIRRGCF
jgi:hypothetical protein